MVKVKHFQYTGIDDYDNVIDDQINQFIIENKLKEDDIIDIKYQSHDSNCVNTYSALLIYRK